MAADFERSNWRMQLYVQGEFAFLNFQDKNPELLLDKIDKNILSELQKDGRISNADLSKRVGLKPFPDA